MDVSPELSELFCTMMRAGRQEVAQAILSEPDCDVHHRTSGGQTPLHVAAMSFMPGIVALLIAKGADTNVLDDRGRTPLMIAPESTEPGPFWGSWSRRSDRPRCNAGPFNITLSMRINNCINCNLAEEHFPTGSRAKSSQTIYAYRIGETFERHTNGRG